MKKLLVFAVMYLLIYKIFCIPLTVSAFELSDYDIEVCDGYVDGEYFDFDFSDVVKYIYSSETESQKITDKLLNILLSEIRAASGTVLLCIGIIAAGAVFKNMTEVLNNSGISNAATFVVYAAVMALLIKCFETGYSVAADTAIKVLDFLYTLFPAFFCTIAFSKGSMSAGLLYQFTGGCLCAVNVVLVKILFPLARYFLILSVINNAADGKKFKTLCAFIKKLIYYVNRILIGIILGMTTIKSLTVPLSDTMKNTFIKKAIACIPGIGTGASAIADTVVSCGNVIKSTLGIAGIIIIFVIMVIPFIKLFSINLLINFMGAVMEPISPEKVINGINAVSDGFGILIYITGTGAITLMSIIGILCLATGG
jgi:stage III sporulation protein AE